MSGARRVLAFRHSPSEGLGYMEAALTSRGLAFEYCDLYLGQAAPPDIAAYGGLIFLGGPMSVNDNLPFIAEEMRIAQHAAARGAPLLGVCLGSQLMAAALGGRVYRNSEYELGWFDVDLTASGCADPLLSALSPSECVFHWHGDTYDLPPGAEWLAHSARTRHQAYRIGRAVYGLQFHLEATPAMIVDWLKQDENCANPAEAAAPIDAWWNGARCRDAAQALFGRWCDLLTNRP